MSSPTKVDEKVARGQKIRTETGPDKEKDIPGISGREALLGRKMGGGPTDISHSITGAGNVKRL